MRARGNLAGRDSIRQTAFQFRQLVGIEEVFTDIRMQIDVTFGGVGGLQQIDFPQPVQANSLFRLVPAVFGQGPPLPVIGP